MFAVLTILQFAIPYRETDSMETLTRLYIKEIVSRHGVPISIISDVIVISHPDSGKSLKSAWVSSDSKNEESLTLGTLDKILERIGPVEYKLELPEELINIHNTFHVSIMLKKFLI
ncbi:hypothetical protein Tco_0281247 [Tanacetum coccineum]